jgi:hypothetical protein
MRLESFLRWNGARSVLGIGVLAVVCLAGSASAQEPAGTPAEPAPGFEPRFIDADSYRDSQVLLHDWPALTDLVRWSVPLAEAISLDDATLPAAEEFGESRTAGGGRSACLPGARGFRRLDPDAVEARSTRPTRCSSKRRTSLTRSGGTPNVADRDRTYAHSPTAGRCRRASMGEADSLPGPGSRRGTVTYGSVAEALEEPTASSTWFEERPVTQSGRSTQLAARYRATPPST